MTTTAEETIIATTNALFSAMRSKDAAAMRELMHPETRFTSVRVDSKEVRVRTGEEFIAAIVANENEIDERITNATVLSDDDFATLWAPYEFYLGRELSHRGTDAFQFIRSAERWLLLSATYTLRK